MSILRLLLSATAALVLTACATTQPAVSRSLVAQFSNRGVDADVVQKVAGGRALGVDDIAACTQRGVPDGVLIPYLQSTRKIYALSPGERQVLQAAGASADLLAYLGRTAADYGGRGAPPQSHPYYSDPGYAGKAPFAYDPPIISEMYNSSYEEALYSPFSFNN